MRRREKQIKVSEAIALAMVARYLHRFPERTSDLAGMLDYERVQYVMSLAWWVP